MRLFYPSSSVPPQYFIGRNNEISKVCEGLASTKEGNGQNFIVYGKKGIGKTTFLRYIRTVATTNQSDYYGEEFNFITLNLIMRNNIDLSDLLHLIMLEIKYLKNETSNLIKRKTKEFWESIPISGISFFGLSVDVEKTSYEGKSVSLIKNVLFKTIKTLLENARKSNFDGLLLILDEANYLNNLNQFSDFFREIILEINKTSSDNNLMIILAGHSDLQPTWLHKSRNTNFVKLSKLTSLEIMSGLRYQYFKKSIESKSIDLECLKIVKAFSKGHPFLFQKFGYFLEKNKTNNRFELPEYIWGIFHPKYYDHELKLIFNSEEYLSKEDKDYITTKTKEVIIETFNTLAPGHNFRINKFWEMYFEDPENLYLHCQIEILSYWKNYKSKISSCGDYQIIDRKWEEVPLITSWLNESKTKFSEKLAKYIFKDVESMSLAFSNYYFCFDGMNSTYSIAQEFLDDSNTLDENAQIVWLKIVRMCEYLAPLVSLFQPTIGLNKNISFPLDDSDEIILNAFIDEIETEGYSEVPQRIRMIGGVLMQIEAFTSLEQYSL